ncbi:MAG: hypothetical protein Q8O00_10005 [Holophaga sp.]|nr:hypothetical protein [Holophaga sp.]
MTNLRCSFFPTALDTHPHTWSGTWPALCRGFANDRMPAPHPADADPKRYLPAICGATFTPGSTRAGANVVSIQLASVDIDNGEETPDPSGRKHPSGRPMLLKRVINSPATIGLICDELLRRRIAGYAWETWSSTREWPRLRLVLPLNAPILPDLWGTCTEWILETTGLNRWRMALDLPVLRDTARLHFLPARRPGAPSVERREIPGDILEPPTSEELVLLEPPKTTLHPWQMNALALHGSTCHPTESGKAGWAKRFRASDGNPLDLRTLDAVRLLESINCRVGPGRPWGSGMKHRTSCPWFEEHSHQTNDDSGVLFKELGRWPAWHCSHSHHSHLGLADLMEAAGVLR